MQTITSERNHPLENKVPPPIVCLITGAFMWGLYHFGPTFQIGRELTLIGVVVFGALGLFYLAAGFLSFNRAGTTIDPVQIDRASALVTGGIFRFTRNPMYVGFTALLLAWASYLATPWMLSGPLFFVLFINRFQITPEERVMSAKFGSAYDDYRKRVRRWL